MLDQDPLQPTSIHRDPLVIAWAVASAASAATMLLDIPWWIALAPLVVPPVLLALFIAAIWAVFGRY